MVGGTLPEGLRAGREVRCPDRMPGTRLGPETRMRKATRRTGPEQGRNTTQRRGTRGGGWRSRSWGQGSSRPSQGTKREEAGQSRNRPVQDSGGGRMCGRRRQSSASIWASAIENREQRRATGSQAGAWPREGGDKTGQTGLSGQASAHAQREVQEKLRCTCRRADAGRAPVRFHARERRWRQNRRRPCDSCHHDGVASARGGGEGRGQTNRLNALVRRCRHAAAVGNDAGVLMLDWD